MEEGEIGEDSSSSTPENPKFFLGDALTETPENPKFFLGDAPMETPENPKFFPGDVPTETPENRKFFPGGALTETPENPKFFPGDALMETPKNPKFFPGDASTETPENPKFFLGDAPMKTEGEKPLLNTGFGDACLERDVRVIDINEDNDDSEAENGNLSTRDDDPMKKREEAKAKALSKASFEEAFLEKNVKVIHIVDLTTESISMGDDPIEGENTPFKDNFGKACQGKDSKVIDIIESDEDSETENCKLATRGDDDPADREKALSKADFDGVFSEKDVRATEMAEDINSAMENVNISKGDESMEGENPPLKTIFDEACLEKDVRVVNTVEQIDSATENTNISMGVDDPEEGENAPFKTGFDETFLEKDDRVIDTVKGGNLGMENGDLPTRDDSLTEGERALLKTNFDGVFLEKDVRAIDITKGNNSATKNTNVSMGDDPIKGETALFKINFDEACLEKYNSRVIDIAEDDELATENSKVSTRDGDSMKGEKALLETSFDEACLKKQDSRVIDIVEGGELAMENSNISIGDDPTEGENAPLKTSFDEVLLEKDDRVIGIVEGDNSEKENSKASASDDDPTGGKALLKTDFDGVGLEKDVGAIDIAKGNNLAMETANISMGVDPMEGENALLKTNFDEACLEKDDRVIDITKSINSATENPNVSMGDDLIEVENALFKTTVDKVCLEKDSRVIDIVKDSDSAMKNTNISIVYGPNEGGNAPLKTGSVTVLDRNEEEALFLFENDTFMKAEEEEGDALFGRKKRAFKHGVAFAIENKEVFEEEEKELMILAKQENHSPFFHFIGEGSSCEQNEPNEGNSICINAEGKEENLVQKHSRPSYLEEIPSVYVHFKNLTSEGRKKLKELLSLWADWQGRNINQDPENMDVEEGEETYFPVFQATDRSTVQFWMDKPRKKARIEAPAISTPLATGSQNDEGNVPLYDRACNTTLSTNDNLSSLEECTNSPENVSRCFNCGSYSHALKDCPRPRDFNAISNARKMHAQSKGASGSRISTRYYQNSPGGKYEDLKPGVLGSEARQCLGIGELDPPPWLNRMRELGYPPGYIEDVEEPSGIAIFGVDEDCEDGTHLGEDGEIIEKRGSPDRARTKGKKLVEFPGINAPIPDNADERLWATPARRNIPSSQSFPLQGTPRRSYPSLDYGGYKDSSQFSHSRHRSPPSFLSRQNDARWRASSHSHSHSHSHHETRANRGEGYREEEEGRESRERAWTQARQALASLQPKDKSER